MKLLNTLLTLSILSIFLPIGAMNKDMLGDYKSEEKAHNFYQKQNFDLWNLGLEFRAIYNHINHIKERHSNLYNEAKFFHEHNDGRTDDGFYGIGESNETKRSRRLYKEHIRQLNHTTKLFLPNFYVFMQPKWFQRNPLSFALLIGTVTGIGGWMLGKFSSLKKNNLKPVTASKNQFQNGPKPCEDGDSPDTLNPYYNTKIYGNID
jgi:hypothetical protein